MSSPDGGGRGPRRRALRILGSILYWLAVIVISLALVVGLVLLLEARDVSEIGTAGAPLGAGRGAP